MREPPGKGDEPGGGVPIQPLAVIERKWLWKRWMLWERLGEADQPLCVCAAFLLHDEVAGAPLQDGLNVGLLVSRGDEEAERGLPYSFERRLVDFDRSSTSGLGALADERQQLTCALDALLELRDVDVHLAEERLVADRPLFPR